MSAAVAEEPVSGSKVVGRVPRRYTVEEFERLPEMKGYELVDGLPVEKPMGNRSGFVSINLIAALVPYVRQHRLGFVGGSNDGYSLDLGDRTQLRKPDVSFVARGRYRDDVLTDGYAPFAPDFALESVSPNDDADKLQAKIEEYLKSGVRLVWVAYPEAQIVLAYRPDGTVRRHVGTDPLSADDLFPGFACTPADLFAVG